MVFLTVSGARCRTAACAVFLHFGFSAFCRRRHNFTLQQQRYFFDSFTKSAQVYLCKEPNLSIKTKKLFTSRKYGDIFNLQYVNIYIVNLHYSIGYSVSNMEKTVTFYLLFLSSARAARLCAVPPLEEK